MRLPTRILLPAAVLPAVILLAGCSQPAEPGPTTPPPQAAAPALPLDYVALGDSYAAMGSASAPTTGPGPCVRSADNYPAGVLADPRIAGAAGADSTDASCSGAETEHILGPWEIGGQVIPAQADSLSPETDLVTLSIGGNDINFSALVDCFTAALATGQPTACAGQLDPMATATLAELPARLDAVYDEIAARSPGARVVATGYLPLVTAEGTCADVASMSQADRQWVVGLTERLNDTVRQAANRHGASFVLPADAAAHTGCADPQARWVDFFGVTTDAYPMHPTAAGQKAMAEAVLADIAAR